MHPSATLELARQIRSLGLHGFDGDCGLAAIEINERVFGGRGRYVAALSRRCLNEDRFVGHAAVYFEGHYWDARGMLFKEDLFGFGDVFEPGDAVLVEFDDANEIRRIHEMQRR